METPNLDDKRNNGSNGGDGSSANSKKHSSKKKPKPASPQKKLAWTFPKNTLEDAIRLAQLIEEKNAGKPIKAEDLAKIVGFKVNDWRFLDVLLSANKYGILEGSGTTATVSLTALGSDIVVPSSPAQRQKALLLAFNNVEQFKGVADFYAGKHIPEDEYFGNTITREFGVPRERVEPFIQIFKTNVEYLKAFAAVDGKKILSFNTPKIVDTTSELKTSSPVSTIGEQPNVREFLDTCFVLMPFGDWFDRYYNEIFIPAIKDAGFEPVRADGLFNSGSVMEQIWEQIKKAKVCLADLTGKNPNVFYELGLAHAVKKPVVFVAGNLEDVPFDVRHLRVVIYEVREPKWDEKLRKSITTYLKNAKSDPAKSIPQPFREPANSTSELVEDRAPLPSPKRVAILC